MTASLLAASIAVLGLAQAQPPRPDPKILNVQFTNGTFARVHVLKLEAERVQLRVLVLDGSIEVRHDLSDFEPDSAFRIELEARQPDSFADHFRMAQRAARLGLATAAGEQAMLALDRRFELESPDKARRMVESWATRRLESWLRESLEQRDLDESTHYLKLLSTRFGHAFPEARLDELATAVEQLERDRSARRRAERQARLDAKIRSFVERRLKPIRRAVQQGDDLLREAVGKSRSMTKSANLATRAIEVYRAAWRDAAKLQAKTPTDKPLVIEIEELANHLHDHSVRAALHAANMLTVRSDFNGAMEWVQRVLALDPTNAEAREMQRTIAAERTGPGAIPLRCALARARPRRPCPLRARSRRARRAPHLDDPRRAPRARPR